MEKRALIAMSGGVDSSVAAAVMCKNGYECAGVMMKLFQNETVDIPAGHTCCSLDDAEDARGVAFRLGMKFYVANFTEDFSGQVIDRFVAAYESGATPNPCIDCNRYMKFERLYRRARELECETIVTGHYARVGYEEKSGRWLLKRAKDQAKDQSYVLYFLTQEQLSHTQFPLGEFESKEQVRELASRYGFANAGKHDSQDICFVPDGRYGDFLERYTGRHYPVGKFVDTQGRVLGEHRGIVRYTIGQRKGLGLALPAPMYVCRKDMAENTVVLSSEDGLYRRELIAEDFNWIAYERPKTPVRVTAKPRYRAREAAATAEVLTDGRVRVLFDEPQRALTIGQAIVLYDGEMVVGGGTIREVSG